MQDSAKHKPIGIIVGCGHIPAHVLALISVMEHLELACGIANDQSTQSVHELNEQKFNTSDFPLAMIAPKIDCDIVVPLEDDDEKRFYENYCKKPVLIIMKNDSIKLIDLRIRSPGFIEI